MEKNWGKGFLVGVSVALLIIALFSYLITYSESENITGGFVINLAKYRSSARENLINTNGMYINCYDKNIDDACRNNAKLCKVNRTSMECYAGLNGKQSSNRINIHIYKASEKADMGDPIPLKEAEVADMGDPIPLKK